MAKKISTKFVCQACGYESPKWMGRCPNCSAWNQMEEEVIADKNNRRSRVSMTGKSAKAQTIQELRFQKYQE
jgi:DNA repair protein RadA/Sms